MEKCRLVLGTPYTLIIEPVEDRNIRIKVSRMTTLKERDLKTKNFYLICTLFI